MNIKHLIVLTLSLILTACTSYSGNGHSEVYGEIKTGIESSHTSIGH